MQAECPECPCFSRDSRGAEVASRGDRQQRNMTVLSSSFLSSPPRSLTTRLECGPSFSSSLSQWQWRRSLPMTRAVLNEGIANKAAQTLDNALGKVPVGQGATKPKTSDTETMKAIVWHGKQKVSCDLVPKPLITHAKDAIVKVTACSICSGSDSNVYCGEFPDTEKGQIMGHESCGIVTEVGHGVTKFKPGDRVVVACDIACGECEYCQRRQYSACEVTNDSKAGEFLYGHRHAAIFGYGSALGGVPGSQAEFVRVPFADTNLYRIPDEVPDEKALYLSDVLCTSYHAVKMGELSKGETVAIWGLGPIGLCAARWAQILGASRVIGIDSVPDRVRLAKEKLGIETINREEVGGDVQNKLMELVPGGVDVAIEAAGYRFATTLVHKVERAVGLETDTADIINECMYCLKKWGRLSIIGDYAGFCNQFAIGAIQLKHLTVRSGQCPCQRYFEEVMEHVRSGEMDPTFMITHRIPLENVPEAYHKLFYKEDGYVKVFIPMT